MQSLSHDMYRICLQNTFGCVSGVMHVSRVRTNFINEAQRSCVTIRTCAPSCMWLPQVLKPVSVNSTEKAVHVNEVAVRRKNVGPTRNRTWVTRNRVSESWVITATLLDR
jgi:hypothetical protein